MALSGYQGLIGSGRRRAHLLALEPRMMFDAAAVATAEKIATTADSAAHASAVSTAAPEPAHAVIFIDTAVADYQQLAKTWAGQGEVVLIDSRSDGIAQMQAALAGESNVSAIHIVSHGSEGAFYLGTTRVDEASITGALSGSLAAIGRSLEPGGDILVYGCDFAEGSDGARALDAFAAATGADVAASTDLTGAHDLGADWTLEAHHGTIEARTLDGGGWEHTLADKITISVQPDSLTVTDGAGHPVVTTAADYGSDNRSPDVGQGAVATWAGAATYQGRSIDLKATVVSISDGDAIRFNRPGIGANGDDATFLLRDLTTANDASVQIRWALVDHITGDALPANVEFTISDIDGVPGKDNGREAVTASTDHLSYYTHETQSDIVFKATLDQVMAIGTKDENTDPSQPVTPLSDATFDWVNVSSFTLTYTLATNSVRQAQFYQDGHADLVYQAPVYTSIPRLTLDADHSTGATGNDAHFVYTAGGDAVRIVDTDVTVSNPMGPDSVTGATVTLTNAKAGDALTILDALPANITGTVTDNGGTISVVLTGAGSEADYDAALRAITFSSSSANPDVTQRVIDVSFSNDVLTSATAVSRIDINHAPGRTGTLGDRAAQDADKVTYPTASAFSDVDGDTLTYTATGLPVGLSIDPSSGVISGTIDRSASQANGGVYTVVVTATDPSHAATTQTFTLAVTNPPPTAADDSATTSKNVPVTIAVLANDSDPDKDPLTVIAASAMHGQVVRNPDGTITYTPGTDYAGTDVIAYTISDGQGGTASANVTVTTVNHPPTARPIPDSYTTQDGAPVTLQAAAAFADADGDRLTYAATGLPAGLSIDPSSGVISGTVDRSASQVNGGVYTVVLTATDTSGASATQTGTVRVVNPAPQATDDSATTAEDTPVVIAVLANDSDPDRDPLTVIAASAMHGQVVRNADGTITYTPDRDYNGADTIAYTISDGQGGTASAQVQVTVTPVNDPPVAVGALSQHSTLDGNAVAWATASGFSDVDGDTLTYTATGLPVGLSIDPSSGIISGTIDRSASQANGGVYTILVTATDPSGAAAQQHFTVEVGNPAPTAVDDSATTHVDTPVTIRPLANDSDPDGDPLSVTGASAGHGSVAIGTDGSLVYTPEAGFQGTDTIAYAISDGQGGTAHAVVTVTVTDTPPAAAPIGTQRAQDGDTVMLPVASRFTDADGDTLSFSATGLPPGLTIDPATGVIAGTIDHSASRAPGGIYDSVVTASDGHGGTTSQTVRWVVTDPAPVANDDTAATDQGRAVVIAPLANDGDPDGDPLTVVAAGAGHGTVAINPDGTITYTPDAGFSGTDTILYTISDGDGGRASSRIAVTVAHVDGAPATAGLPPRSDVDGAAVTLPLATAFSDPDGDALRFTATGLPAGLSIDPVTGVVSGTLAPGGASGGPGHDGRYPVTVTATDPAGAQTSTTFLWSVGTAGPAARNDTATTAEDTAVRIDALANDSDPDGLAITLADASATHGSVAIVNGALVFTPDADFNGDAVISYTITDSAGHRASAVVEVTVTPVNDAPGAKPIPDLASQDGDGGIDIAAGDYFFDVDGDRLAFSATGLPAGLSFDPATGHISGAIDRAASQVGGGVYHVVLTATDPSGASATAAFDWAVTNPVPVAHDDSAVTHEDAGVTIPVLANDSDPDGDPLSVADARAAHGTVSINPDGTLAYVPVAGFTGTDLILYTLSDGNGGLATGRVVVTVTPVEHAPVAVDDAATTLAGHATDIAVLANDHDPDGDPLTVTSATAAGGTVTINADGTLRYTPAAGFVGTDTIDYAISDGRGGTATARVTVTVAPVNHPPLAPPFDPVTAIAGEPKVIDVVGRFTDPDGDPLTITEAHVDIGRVAVNPDGTLTYTPPATFIGTATVTFTVSDGRGGAVETTQRVEVGARPVVDTQQLLGIGRSSGAGAGPTLIVATPDGLIRNPFTTLLAINAVRPLDGTRDLSGDTPVGDAVEAARSLRGATEQPDGAARGAILSEVDRLGRLADFRDSADRLFDHRWDDLPVRPMTGFSTAGTHGAGVMMQTLVQGGAIYLDVRDVAPDRTAPIRSIAVTLPDGAPADWITVDPAGAAIIEPALDSDEIHLVVAVTREDGSRSRTPIVIQRATGEIAIDRTAPFHHVAQTARPLDATLHTPHAAARAAAAHLARTFK